MSPASQRCPTAAFDVSRARRDLVAADVTTTLENVTHTADDRPTAGWLTTQPLLL